MLANPNARRNSSILLENAVLIDGTARAFDFVPAGCSPEVQFVTHSHNDHFNAAATVSFGIKRVYVHETWAAAARKELSAAARAAKKPAPEVVALEFGRKVGECGMDFTIVPANHSTSRVTGGVLERAGMYLVEKGASRLLYATDTGGIPGDAARMIGIDPHVTAKNRSKERLWRDNPFVAPPKALTAFIMEATNAMIDDDFRLFVHSSVQTVSRTVDMLVKNGRLAMPEGQKAIITHLALRYRNWPAAKIDAELPPNLRAAFDGLELVLG